MTPEGFASKWHNRQATERAASQEHFINLCQMLGVATPNDDPTGQWLAFEKGASKSGGGEGFADVWKKGHVAGSDRRVFVQSGHFAMSCCADSRVRLDFVLQPLTLASTKPEMTSSDQWGPRFALPH